MDNNNNPNNKKHSHHGGRHRYNRHHKPHNRPAAQEQPNDQGAAVQQTTPQTEPAAQASATASNQHKHHHNKKNHKNNQKRPNNNADQQKNTVEAEQKNAPNTISAGRPARYPNLTESVSEITPEVIFIDEPDTETPTVNDLGVKVGDPDMSYFDFEENSTEENAPSDDATVEVVGVRFRRSGKVYYFDPNGTSSAKGTFVIVDTARGPEYGEVWMSNRYVSEKNIVQPLRQVIRVATDADAERHELNRQKEKEALVICQEKITKHKLEMKLVQAQYTFDNSKLLFYFTSAGRVDFRELVKDLASVFRTRIELRQIGIRDEAKLLGGLGACGRALCCSGFLADFAQVSIKMAKEQNLSLNSNKISGTCGRLMCCLRYENDTYEQEIRKTPPVDSVVKTPEGNGTVIEINPLAGMIKVKIADKQDNVTIKTYHRDLVTVISRPKPEETEEQEKNSKN